MPPAPKPGIYDSMGAAAAASGIPLAMLKKAKRNGSPGFRGSRVHIEEVRAFLYPNGESEPIADLFDSKDELERRKLRLQCERIQREEEEAMGNLVPKAEVKQWMLATAEKVKSFLHSKLKNEMPPKLEGLRAPEIAAKMDVVIVEIVELFREV